jgi:hypothetical protein
MACSGNILVSALWRRHVPGQDVKPHCCESWISEIFQDLWLTTRPGGGIGTTKNRTYWPTTGGAVAFQPGWFQGHGTSFLYINLGYYDDGPDSGPQNMSNPMLPPLQLLGPSKNPYPGTVCFPQLPLPKNAPAFKAGDLATIQVVELAVHGAALYSVCLGSCSLLGIGCNGPLIPC